MPFYSVSKQFFFLALSLLCCRSYCQEPQTIRVKKESNLAKAVFDNVDLRLVVVDRFGNPRDNRLMAYKLYIKGKKETKVFNGFNNQLTPEMMSYLKKLKSSAKLFFTEITAEDDDTHPIKLPDVIDTWFPECSNCDNGNRKKS